MNTSNPFQKTFVLEKEDLYIFIIYIKLARRPFGITTLKRYQHLIFTYAIPPRENFSSPYTRVNLLVHQDANPFKSRLALFTLIS